MECLRIITGLYLLFVLYQLKLVCDSNTTVILELKRELDEEKEQKDLVELQLNLLKAGEYAKAEDIEKYRHSTYPQGGNIPEWKRNIPEWEQIWWQKYKAPFPQKSPFPQVPIPIPIWERGINKGGVWYDICRNLTGNSG